MALTEYVIMPGSDYQAICDSIRSKTGSSELLKSGEVANAIIAISGGGSSGANLTPFLEGEIETFTVPADVDNLRPGVFYGCKLLKAIEVEEGNTAYKAIDGVLYTADGKVLVAYPAGKEGAEYAIPGTVTSVADQAFNGSNVVVVLNTELLNAGGAYPLVTDSIKTVIIPEDATFLDLETFSNLTGVETVYFNATGCAIEVDSVESKGDVSYNRSPFSSCTNLNEIIIGDGITEIPAGGCCNNSAKKLRISPSVTKIGDYAFYQAGFTDVMIPGNVINVGSYGFASGNVSSLTIEEGVTTLGYGAFSNNYNLASVIVPKSVTEIGGWCFGACSNLTNVTILNPNAILGSDLFLFGSDNIIIRGYTGSTAETYAAEKYHTFEAIDVPLTITADNRAMIGYTGTEGEELVIPEIVFDDEDIGYRVIAIAANTFYGCTNLASITIPSSVSSICSQAFSGCTNLNAIAFDGTTYKFDTITKEPGWRDGCDAAIMCTDGEWIETNDFVVTATNRSMIGYTGAEGEELAIPATFEGDDGVVYKVTGIGADAFQNCSGLASVTIPGTVSMLDADAFIGSDNTEVILELNAGTLDAGGVYPVSSNRVNSVVIPEDTKFLDLDAFNNMTGINTVYYNAVDCSAERYQYEEKGMVGYSYTALFNTNLQSIIFGDNVRNIPDGLCYSCQYLDDVIIYNGATNIGNAAFCNCRALTSVIIPNSVANIGDSVFSMCTSLTDVTIFNPDAVIGFETFYNCAYPFVIRGYEGSNAEVYANNNWYEFRRIYDDPSVITDYNRHLIGYTGAEGENLVIPETFEDTDGTVYSVTKIGEKAFKDCANLASVVIPASVTSIDKQAFNQCYGLTSVTILNPEVIIGYEAFYSCGYPFAIRGYAGSTAETYANDNWHNFEPVVMIDGVVMNVLVVTQDNRYLVGYTGAEGENLVIPSTVEDDNGTSYIVGKIGDSAFNVCTGLSSVTIPNGVTSIGESAFASCFSLTSVTIPVTVTSIGYHAFGWADHLSSVTYEGTISEWNAIAFGEEWNYGTSIVNIICSDGVITPPFTITSDNRNLVGYTGEENEVLVIPDNVIGIGEYAFHTCTNLIEVTIPASVMSIGATAFYFCQNLAKINYTGTVEQWNAIQFGENWNEEVPATEVICSDGTVPLTA